MHGVHIIAISTVLESKRLIFFPDDGIGLYIIILMALPHCQLKLMMCPIQNVLCWIPLNCSGKDEKKKSKGN